MAEYEKAVETDVVNVKNNINRFEEAASKKKLFINEVQMLKHDMSGRVVKNAVERIDKTGKILNEYNHIKNLNSKEHFTMVYPDHKEKYAPVFKLDVDKEIEIIANKFRIMSTPGV